MPFVVTDSKRVAELAVTVLESWLLFCLKLVPPGTRVATSYGI
jgi:hypothetical protein